MSHLIVLVTKKGKERKNEKQIYSTIFDPYYSCDASFVL